MFRKNQQVFTRDEFVRYFSNRVVENRISETVFDRTCKVAKVQFLSPLDDLYAKHKIADEDLDDLVRSILSELGLPSVSSDHLRDRPDVYTVEGLVLLVDFLSRAEGSPNL